MKESKETFICKYSTNPEDYRLPKLSYPAAKDFFASISLKVDT